MEVKEFEGKNLEELIETSLENLNLKYKERSPEETIEIIK